MLYYGGTSQNTELDPQSRQLYEALSSDEKKVFHNVWQRIYGGMDVNAALANFMYTKDEPYPGAKGVTYYDEWERQFKGAPKWLDSYRAPTPKLPTWADVMARYSAAAMARRAYGLPPTDDDEGGY